MFYCGIAWIDSGGFSLFGLRAKRVGKGCCERKNCDFRLQIPSLGFDAKCGHCGATVGFQSCPSRGALGVIIVQFHGWKPPEKRYNHQPLGKAT